MWLRKMPELPEVETIKNELSCIIGKRFSEVTIYDDLPVRRPSLEEFRGQLIGQRIQSISRAGKYLLLRLSGGDTLIIHLRMTGALLYNPKNPERFTRVVFKFNDGSDLVFTDTRRFGAMYLVKNELDVVGKLGIEPLTDDFTPEALTKLLAKRKAPIKAVLLDQTVIAGIGNMYADESLFSAKIHPLRKAGDLSAAEVKALYKAIREILIKAIGDKGASISTYRCPSGELGTAHLSFRVAHRGGKPCPRCRTPIKRIAIRNRGSYYCPKCQKI